MIRMNDLKGKATLRAAAVMSAFLLFAAVAGFAQQQINLTAAPTTTTLPDGTTVPMWGYFCGAAVTGSTATCGPLNTQSAATATTAAIWSPVLITVPAGTAAAPAGLTINLTNSLSFPITGSTTAANTIPTSIVIIGQVGGGLGGPPTTTPSPSHANAQGCPTWFIASSATPPGAPCTAAAQAAQAAATPGSTGTPPVQGPRVQSMATEVGAGVTTSLTWGSLKPGTYLLESGTHPSIQVPMGLIGVLVVTNVPSGTTAGTAYPASTVNAAVPYNAELPLEFSEIDPVQNKEVDEAVRTAGFSETAVWTRMNAFGPVTSLMLTSGGTGYTSVPLVTIGAPTSGASPVTATATATVGAIITGATVTGGSGCTNPTIAFADSTGSTGSGAAGTVAVTATGLTVNITSPGNLYSAPTATISGCTTAPTSVAVTTAGSHGVIYSLSLTNGGEGYTAGPSVTFSAAGATAAAVATAAVTMGGCGNGAVHSCYPPVVNYTPLYYLIDGVAFSKANPSLSLFAATAGTAACTVNGVATTCAVTTGISGTVLVRLVNAGLRMHVPSIVGSQTKGFTGAGVVTAPTSPAAGFTLIAEDGNLIPGVAPVGATAVPVAPRVQTHVFMPAGKTYDVLLNVPAACTPAPCTNAAMPIYSRDLGLSANASERDAGALAYIGINGGNGPGLPASAGSGVFAPAQANNDRYPSLAPGQPFTVSDPAKGVLANDVNVYGAVMLTPPSSGTLSCPAMSGVLQQNVSGICANGTFTYTPLSTNTSAAADSFTYCASSGYVPATLTTAASCSSSTLMATVSLSASALTGGPTAITQTYTATTATYIKIAPPGLLFGNSDTNNLTLSVVPSGTALAACASPVSAVCGTVDANGGFTVTLPTPAAPPPAATSQTFSYTVQNSLGKTATGSFTITFPKPANLQVKVLDAQLYKNCNGNSTCISGLLPLTDYRWIIEEDQTFWVDPNCTTNSSATTPGCPSVVGPPGTAAGTTTIPSFGVNFHTSAMPYVAQGCTGPLSCEGGQTMLDTRVPCNAGSTTVPAGCSTTSGTHIYAICDVGAGACRPDPNQTTGSGFTPVSPSEVVLDPAKRYYISVLPGDAANPFPSYVGQPVCTNGTNTSSTTQSAQCGHTMSGAPIPPACNILGGTNACTAASAFAPVNVLVLPTPLPTGKLSVMVFEDDFPLNGEQDGGGGNGTVAPIEPGLGGFNIVLWDTYGGLGDVTGQDTYDDFNMPLSNSLSGTIDPATGLDACPVSANATSGPPGAGASYPNPPQGPPPQAGGITSMIVTCPKYESDNHTLSPLAGQAVIANLMPEKFSVQAYPGADRIARGEQWVQTNTLDGQHPHDSFIRIGEPSYFQEYGPAGYHVAIGFANPAIINARLPDVCAGLGTPGAIPAATGTQPCTNTIRGQVDVQRLSRTPDQRLYPSGSRDALAWTQCWVSLGDPDGEDFMFQFCDAQGNFKFTGVPNGNWRLTLGDQWNDQIIDGLSLPANVGCSPNGPIFGQTTTCNGGQTLDLGSTISAQQWQANLYTRTFIDVNKTGIWDPASGDIGIPFVYTMIHYRDGHNSNSLVTDFNGVANFNETTPLFNWYVVEADSGRYKTTGIHTVYDAGGPADHSPSCVPGTSRPCGTSTAYNFLSNTYEALPLPADLSVPGAVYCASADCATESASFATGTPIPSSNAAGSLTSTGRIDPPWVWAEGWSGMTSQSNWVDFGKAPYAACPPACATVTVTAPGATGPTTTFVGENGGIHGFVAYAATRPFDDASQMIQQPWEPNVPRVTVNLYKEGFAADGVTPTLTLVDTTTSTSWDDWAQGFYANYTDPATGTPLPYMSCPGQGVAPTAAGTTQPPNADLFFFTLYDQPNYLDYYSSLHSGGTLHALPYNSQYKCYDAMHIWNQLQPAPYDGRYFFPSVLGINPNPATNSGPGWLNTAVIGGVGVPVWSNMTAYTVGTVVMYQNAAFVAAKPSLGVVPGSAGQTAWNPNPTGTPSSWVAATMGGTNCITCVPNPDSTDPYRTGTPMLPPGKYVVQVVMPPGYEVYKEEDKNLLIGDNFIAPVTQQFAGLGTNIYIIPDQASVASLYDESASGYNPNNFQDQTTGLGLSEELSGVPGFPGFQDPLWPCVGAMRVVPDYLSLFPNAHEAGPFAGATRPLCDRKEVTLPNQMSVSVKFFIFTSTHIASKYTGVITDDFTSEFDPFAPQFGEKFSPPNLPVSTRDYLGNEISRVYSDHWGTYNGLTFSSWEVNPPNITGYSPTIMVQCMNDPGPVVDNRAGSATLGQLINDPLYNTAYSNFCYEEPYMPGLTNYTDTPVVPTEAFVGAAYNSPDCSYPDATPAIKEVDSQDGIGPWVSVPGHSLTITALGNQLVNNSAYSGPAASAVPFNSKTVSRHYGFGNRCTAVGGTCTAVSSVTIGGAAAVITGWSDTQITVTVPGGLPGSPQVPLCTIQQQNQYGGPPSATGETGPPQARCGELLITAGNGKQSVDTVMVTVGGKTPTHVNASNIAGSTNPSTVQGAIDAAMPGDLLIIDPTCNTVATPTTPSASATCSNTALHPAGTAAPTQTAAVGSHQEMLIMWKPVRLQGVGAASSIINANAQPAGTLLDPWRRHINCLFGLTLQGVPIGSTTATGSANVYDSTNTFKCPDAGWTNFVGAANFPQIDRLTLESVVGWDATLNGNLAEQLQEPSLMGAFEGAGVTVLGKGVDYHGAVPWTDTTEGGAFPTGTTLLTGVGPNPLGLATGDASIYCHTLNDTGTPLPAGATEMITSPTNPYPSNFMCNPSSIDGLSVINSSQGGGGIFAHGWAHHLQIANNRVYNNAGTLTGGITVGQGEFPSAIVQGGTTNAAPGSCSDGTGFVTNQHLPYCLQLQVNVHHNYITNNSSLGDELFSGTLAGGGGATFCTGNDYYLFNYNWVCGNLSSSEGGGVVHLGEIQNGDIEHNAIVLNQSTNPTIVSNGGGIMVQGTPDTDPTCGIQIDADCPPGLSDGAGHNLVINANLIQANMAESGSGGGIRLQQVNGTDVSTFPSQPQYWNNVSITNNMIVNNLSGWDGAGISLQDALNVAIVNNTIASNDSLASSGVLTQSIGTPEASAPPGTCVHTGPTGTTQASCPQVAGVASAPNSSILTTTFTGLTITCPFGEPNTGSSSCLGFSNPLLQNNVIWQNRSFEIGVGTLGSGNLNQQNVITLFNASGGAAPVQSVSGACTGTAGSTGTATYWDIGVRGDAGPSSHGSGFTLSPINSVLDDTGYASSNSTTNPSIVSQYCNGSRVPPECTVADGCGGPSGYGVPPGIVDASAPNPVFSLTPSATVDEGNNWINVSWGPLALSNDALTGGTNGNYGGGALFANYALAAGSPAIDSILVSSTNFPTATVPNLTKDFFGNPRPDSGNPNHFDVGAVEFQGTSTPILTTASVSPTTLAFGSQGDGAASPAMTVTVTNTGNTALAGGAFTFGGGTPQPFSRPAGAAGGTCGATLAVGASCTINVVFTPTTPTAFSRTLTIAYTGATVTGSPVTLTGTGIARGTGSLTFTSATNGTIAGGALPTLTFTIPSPRAPVTSVVTITNNGGGTLQITGETLTVNTGGLYSITGTTCSFTTPLAAGGTCTVSIRYATPATAPSTVDVGQFSAPNNGPTASSNFNGLLGLRAQ